MSNTVSSNTVPSNHGLLLCEQPGSNSSILYADRPTTDGNSGYDLFLESEMKFPPKTVTFVKYGLSAMTTDGTGFFLLPRSSISKTPLRMANSVGLIDPTYRGPIIAALDNTSSVEMTVPVGTRLVQLVRADLRPFSVEWQNSLEDTVRGAGGFGSSGK